MAKKADKNWVTEQAIALVQGEKDAWEDSLIYVTERVAFKMRDLIRICYKNYWGIYDNPIDPMTLREKVWYPLSEEVANGFSDNSHLDQKDVQTRTAPGGSYAMTQVSRQILKDFMYHARFGEIFDNSATTKSIVGTAIWKVSTTKKNGVKKPRVREVHRLNFYIDPTAESIQDAYRVTERSLMFPDEMKQMTGWKHTDNLEGAEGLPSFDPEVIKGQFGGNSVTRDVWEMWGKIPECLITGDQKDKEEVDGHVVVSGLEAGTPVCHLIEENLDKDRDGNILKPYEEDWAEKVPGRWDGRGPVEKVMMLQVWINTLINIRINRSYVSQLGLWKVKRGANITPQTIQKLGSNGAILVSSMDDIEQLVMKEASEASYKDEQNIRDIAKRITRTLESITGERMPASMPATNASIQASASKNAFVKIRDRAAFFVERLFNRHLMKDVIETYPKEKLVRILQDDTSIDEIIDRIAFHHVQKYISEQELMGKFLMPDQMMTAINEAREELRSRPEIFIKQNQEILADLIDVTITASNESLDTGTTVDKLIMAANLLPEDAREPISRIIFDVLGVNYPQELNYRNQVSTQMPQPSPEPTSGMQGLPNEIANVV